MNILFDVWKMGRKADVNNWQKGNCRELHTINIWSKVAHKRPLLTSVQKRLRSDGGQRDTKIGLFMSGNLLSGQINLLSACV